MHVLGNVRWRSQPLNYSKESSTSTNSLSVELPNKQIKVPNLSKHHVGRQLF